MQIRCGKKGFKNGAKNQISLTKLPAVPTVQSGGGFFLSCSPLLLSGRRLELFLSPTPLYRASGDKRSEASQVKIAFFLLMRYAFSHILQNFFKFSKFFKIFKKCQIQISAIKTSPTVPIKWGFMGKNAHPPLVCS